MAVALTSLDAIGHPLQFVDNFFHHIVERIGAGPFLLLSRR